MSPGISITSMLSMIFRCVRAFATREPLTRVRRLYETVDFTAAHFQHRGTTYINTGYWEPGETSTDEAGQAFARKLAKAAGFQAGDRILDVGCGYGEQDFTWLGENDPAKIFAIDLTPRCIDAARRRAESLELSDRLDFRVGNGCELPFTDGSFDRVVALDCAHLFPSRAAFISEAFRVLRPGGTLAISDIIPSDGRIPLKAFRSHEFYIHIRLVISQENWHDRHIYVDRLSAAGFVDVEAPSVREFTLVPLYRRKTREEASEYFTKLNVPSWVKKFMLGLAQKDYQRVQSELHMLDSVIATARKPLKAPATDVPPPAR